MEESKKNLVEKVNTSFHCMFTSLKNYFQQRVPFGPCLTNFCKTEEHLYKFILQNRKAYTTKFEELWPFLMQRGIFLVALIIQARTTQRIIPLVNSIEDILDVSEGRTYHHT